MKDFIINWRHYSSLLDLYRKNKDWKKFDETAESFTKFQKLVFKTLSSEKYEQFISIV